MKFQEIKMFALTLLFIEVTIKWSFKREEA